MTRPSFASSPPSSVFREVLFDPELLAHLVNRIQLVGGVFVGTEDAEVVHVQLHHVAQENAQRPGVFGLRLTRLFELDPVLAEVGQAQGFLQAAAVGVRIRAHAPRTGGRQLAELGGKLAVAIEQFLGPLRPHPAFENAELLGILLHIRQRHLVSSPEAFQPVAFDFDRSRPAFGRAQHDHRPARTADHAFRRAPPADDCLISRTQCSTVAAIAWCMLS